MCCCASWSLHCQSIFLAMPSSFIQPASNLLPSMHAHTNRRRNAMQVCNHKFHNECLQQWGDASCPVCRYSVSQSHDSSCAVCGSTSDLWMCLICGHVGCGRYNAAHARDHYAATSHCYSLETETGRVRTLCAAWCNSVYATFCCMRSCHFLSMLQHVDISAVPLPLLVAAGSLMSTPNPRNTTDAMPSVVQVWDYAGDGYVHRLIQSHLDGKLVEVPSPEPSNAAARARHRRSGGAAGSGDGSQKGSGGSAASRPGGLESVAEERVHMDDMNMLEVCSPYSRSQAIYSEYNARHRAQTYVHVCCSETRVGALWADWLLEEMSIPLRCIRARLPEK